MATAPIESPVGGEEGYASGGQAGEQVSKQGVSNQATVVSKSHAICDSRAVQPQRDLDLLWESK